MRLTMSTILFVLICSPVASAAAPTATQCFRHRNNVAKLRRCLATVDGGERLTIPPDLIQRGMGAAQRPWEAADLVADAIEWLAFRPAFGRRVTLSYGLFGMWSYNEYGQVRAKRSDPGGFSTELRLLLFGCPGCQWGRGWFFTTQGLFQPFDGGPGVNLGIMRSMTLVKTSGGGELQLFGAGSWYFLSSVRRPFSNPDERRPRLQGPGYRVGGSWTFNMGPLLPELYMGLQIEGGQFWPSILGRVPEGGYPHYELPDSYSHISGGVMLGYGTGVPRRR